MNKSMIQPNDTMRFLLPMLYTKDYNDEFFFNKYFMGAYTSDINYPEMDDKLILVYRYLPEPEYITFEECLLSLPTYYAKYEYEGLDVLAYVFDIPKEFEQDYELFINKKFNDLSSTLKLNIIKMWKLNSDDLLFKVVIGVSKYEGESFDKQIFNIEEYDNSNDLYDQLVETLKDSGGDPKVEEII